MKKQIKKTVVVIGAGFGGLEVVKKLRKAPVDIILIDKNNHNLFQPLLYQIAISAISPADISVSIRSIFRNQENVTVLQDEVLEINRDKACVIVHNREINYDYLVVATGSVHSYFGHDDWARIAPGIKNLSEAIEIRNRVLSAFETAEKCTFECNKISLMSFVIVGGGPTGVELAGALAELTKITFSRDFRNIDPQKTKIYLVEAGKRLLPSMPESLSIYTKEKLEQKGVEILLNSPVTSITNDCVETRSRTIMARTTIWAAGVKASPLSKSLNTELDNLGRVITDTNLSVKGDKKVFVIGDMAHVKKQNGQLVPGISPAAIQEGRFAAKNITLSLNNKTTKEFHYIDKGSMTTIGRAAAVAAIGKVNLKGFAAWIIWIVVHIFYLINFRNRFLVLIQWAWTYFTYKQYSRLIIFPWLPWADGIPDSQIPKFQGCNCKIKK